MLPSKLAAKADWRARDCLGHGSPSRYTGLRSVRGDDCRGARDSRGLPRLRSAGVRTASARSVPGHHNNTNGALHAAFLGATTVGTFDHIHIYATDVTATIEFYKTVLDAETIGSLTNASGGLNHLLILGGQYIAISAFPVGMAARNPTARLEGALDVGFGIVHFGFNVDDIDAFIERAQHHGCEIHGEPQSSGPLRYVYFTAPDGVVVELTQYVLPPKLQLAGAGMRSVNRIIHSVRRWIGRRMIAAAQQ